jgi:hypothetical protein
VPLVDDFLDQVFVLGQTETNWPFGGTPRGMAIHL